MMAFSMAFSGKREGYLDLTGRECVISIIVLCNYVTKTYVLLLYVARRNLVIM